MFGWVFSTTNYIISPVLELQLNAGMLDDFVRRFSEEHASGFQPFTPLKTNMLEDVSPTEIVPFWGTCWIWRVFLFVRRGEVPKI